MHYMSSVSLTMASMSVMLPLICRRQESNKYKNSRIYKGVSCLTYYIFKLGCKRTGCFEFRVQCQTIQSHRTGILASTRRKSCESLNSFHTDTSRHARALPRSSNSRHHVPSTGPHREAPFLLTECVLSRNISTGAAIQTATGTFPWEVSTLVESCNLYSGPRCLAS